MESTVTIAMAVVATEVTEVMEVTEEVEEAALCQQSNGLVQSSLLGPVLPSLLLPSELSTSN